MIDGRVGAFDAESGALSPLVGPQGPPVKPDAVLVPVDHGILVVGEDGIRDAGPFGIGAPGFGPGQPTATPAVADEGRTMYAVFRVGPRTSAVRVKGIVPQRPEWTQTLAGDVRVTPVVSPTSVYVVAGPALYRLDRKTGAVGWRLTLPLRPNEAVATLTLDGGEIRAAGAGFVVRVRNWPGPAAAKVA